MKSRQLSYQYRLYLSLSVSHLLKIRGYFSCWKLVSMVPGLLILRNLWNDQFLYKASLVLLVVSIQLNIYLLCRFLFKRPAVFFSFSLYLHLNFCNSYTLKKFFLNIYKIFIINISSCIICKQFAIA